MSFDLGREGWRGVVVWGGGRAALHVNGTSTDLVVLGLVGERRYT